MLGTKDVMKPMDEVLGNRFVLAAAPEGRNGFVGGQSTGTVDKYVFLVKAMDVCQTFEVTVKDSNIKPDAIPTGSELAFDGLRVNLYAQNEDVKVSVSAKAVRALKSMEKSGS